MVIVTAGGDGQSVMAFRQQTGELVWKSGDFLISPSTPLLVDVDGETQLIVLGGQTVNGLDPDTGRVIWSHDHETGGDMNNATPLWGGDNVLVVSSSYDGGTRALRLSREGATTQVEELWFSRRLRVMFSNALLLGDYVFGSSGDFGPAILTALEVETGAEVWQSRGFGRSSFVYADGKVILLDEDGRLVLARFLPEGLEVLSEAPVLETTAWSAPSLVGATLYIRDREQVIALDVGVP
jgi:outer membrane protein assembly factor BamB